MERIKKLWELVKKFKWWIFGGLGCFVVLVGGYIGGSYFFDGRVVPGTIVSGVDVGLMKRNEVEEALGRRIAEIEERGILFETAVQEHEFSVAELGGEYDLESSLGKVEYMNGNYWGWEVLNGVLVGDEEFVVVEFDREGALEKIEDVFQLRDVRGKNATIALENGEFVVVDAREGKRVLEEKLVVDILDELKRFGDEAVVLKFEDEAPTVVREDLEARIDDIRAVLKKKFVLKAEAKEWKLSLGEHLDWVAFEEGVTFDFVDEEFGKYLAEVVAPELEVEVGNVYIKEIVGEKLGVEGRPKDGRRIDYGKTILAFEGVVNEDFAKEEGQNKGVVEVALEEVAHEVVVDDFAKSLGVNGLVGQGYTTFYGSPRNRVHNISVGIGRYNGLLIAPGEEFSFNAHLGPVDARTGYRPELVIKGDETIPEYGGGLCQVSTTLYRAALYGGLPIKQRSSHSYAVSYYSQIGGHGLDATIYPEAGKDVVFVNDSGGYLLVQSYIDGYEAYFNLYGTSDGRKVEMEGPYVSNYHGPGEPVLEETGTLREGERKMVENAHNGFDVTWFRYVEKDGEKVKEPIISNYRAVPAKYLVGKGEEQS